jgi:tetratricopeptide (TPR) repeat protein
MTEPTVEIQPIVAWPRQARRGGQYIVEADLGLTDPQSWPYAREEFVVGCILEGGAAFEVQALGETSLVLHRFGGTYGPVRFRVRAERDPTAADPLRLTYLTEGGVPIRSIQLPVTPADTATPPDVETVVITAPSAPAQARAFETDEPRSSLPPAGRPGGTAVVEFAPGRNTAFIGRREQLDAMSVMLDRRPWRPLVLHGPDGVGKSRLTAEFLTRHASEYDLACGIVAEEPSEVRAALVKLGERLGWPAAADQMQTVRTVLTRLESGDLRWLIVFDNVGPPEEIRRLLPGAGGQLVITTPDPAWLGFGNVLEIGTFTRAESVELLRSRGYGGTSDQADRLAERLGDLPLALEQAAVMQSATRISVDDYLRQLDDQVLGMVQTVPAGLFPSTVVAAFMVAVDRVGSESPGAARLLEMASCLGAEPISLFLLRSGGEQIPAPLGRMLSQHEALDQAIRQLRRYGLIEVVDDGQAFQVHQVVKAIVREMLSAAARDQAYANARHVLTTANPGRPRDPLTWDIHQRIGPHLRPARMIEVTEPDALRTVLDQVTYLHEIGDYEGSLRLGEQALAAWPEQGLAEVHYCLLHVVAALHEMGRFQEALRRAEQAWSRLAEQTEYGPDHPVTLQFASSLAWLHRVCGDYQHALARDSEMVLSYRTVRGDDHAMTLAARNNLAISLRAVGDFRAAYDIDVQLAESRRNLLGPDRVETLVSESNLARDLYGLGDYGAALSRQQSSWPALQGLLGDRHPLVLAARRTIVIGLRKTGDVTAALGLSATLYTTCQSWLGTDHETTLAAMMTYANALLAAGEQNRARSLSAEAVDRYRRVLGPRNPLTLAAVVNQAIILRVAGDRSRARSVGEAAYRGLREVVGRDHPYSIAAGIGVANDLVLAHEESGARELLASTLDLARGVWGERHPDTLTCVINLGLLEPDPGRRRALVDSSINILRRLLGDRHPLVATAVAGRPGECDIEPPPI